MHKSFRRPLFILALILLLTLLPVSAQAASPARSALRPSSSVSVLRRQAASSGKLVKTKKGLRYRVSKGNYLVSKWKKIGSRTYYFSKTTYALKGFQYIGGKIYYFNASCVLQKKGQTVKGKKLRFNKDGSVYSYGGVRYNISKGQQVVNYARRFVGNPYRWGGSSLTHGADCSGFVMAVYAHFNVYLPHYDASIRKCGRAVPGLSAARPGDVICYRGHVAIYMGNNRIIHAASERYGICIWNNASYTRILSIRRFF